ncbi:retinoid-inducible serine carboxypeptidase-like [Rhynchophorus ferrugineus]|uniref:retinoid-inducible serine carboxypeptidase-like n=1 Tax=Rhynchophorus ferrugineus TaxID=354439 RepID=UPI003FCD0B46
MLFQISVGDSFSWLPDRKMNLFLVLVWCLCLVNGKSGFGGTDEKWGYAKVNEKAHMFWWLYYTTATSDYTQRPLVIWLQGGPGGSSTGIGNFLEIGPVDVTQQPREINWISYLNVLFVDNPVGTGFSYVENNDTAYFAKNNTAIAQNFLVFLQGFLNENSEFQKVPIYIFGQSYGGKMAVDIAWLINQESKAGNVNCNLKGIALGDSWISPIDSLISWPNYLYNLGFLDTEEFNTLKTVTDYIQEDVANGNFENATQYFHATQFIINKFTSVDYYNVMKEQNKVYNLRNSEWKENPEDVYVLKGIIPYDIFESLINIKQVLKSQDEDDHQTLYKLMNGPVKTALNISDILPIEWGEQSDMVFRAVDLDFMKPVTELVERLLNETDIEVSVYNGQLDLIVDTPGTVAWVNKLHWRYSETWKETERIPIVIDNIYEGYQKRYKNFNLYWVHRAGHSVPADNPHTMASILKQITHID